MRLNLLSAGDKNAKLAKSAKRGVVTFGLSLAPARTAERGNVCPHASPGCVASCIFTAGNGSYRSVSAGRIRKTRLFFDDRAAFLQMLRDDLEKIAKRHQDDLVAIRLNVFSDLNWELLAADIFSDFPQFQFYDYTKNSLRMFRFLSGDFPPNYHLTFSRSERNGRTAIEVLMRGGTVAVPFSWQGLRKRNGLPAKYWGFPVVDGEDTDLRFLDTPGSVIGLKVKGAGRSDTSGFIVSEQSARVSADSPFSELM